LHKKKTTGSRGGRAIARGLADRQGDRLTFSRKKRNIAEGRVRKRKKKFFFQRGREKKCKICCSLAQKKKRQSVATGPTGPKKNPSKPAQEKASPTFYPENKKKRKPPSR